MCFLSNRVGIAFWQVFAANGSSGTLKELSKAAQKPFAGISKSNFTLILRDAARKPPKTEKNV